MFRLPNIPTVDLSHLGRESLIEIADLWEILALRSKRGSASLEDIKSSLQIAADPDPGSDAEDDIDLEGLLYSVLDELKDRVDSCGNDQPAYPFSVRDSGIEIQVPLKPDSVVYVFLLLATRFNMKTERTHAELDGSLLFEELCESVLASIFGERRQSLRFGASKMGGSFPIRVKELCSALNEDLLPIPNPTYKQNSGDDGLDVAAWIPFSDNRRGKHIVFAQCKTGSTWETDDLSRLDPEVFCRLWMNPTPLSTPEKAFMSAKRLGRDVWERTMYGGMFFDRCRIMDYAKNLDAGLKNRLKKWVAAAMASRSFKWSKPKQDRLR